MMANNDPVPTILRLHFTPASYPDSSSATNPQANMDELLLPGKQIDPTGLLRNASLIGGGDSG
jgi:hypothetical protein